MSGPDPSQSDDRRPPFDPYAPVDYPADYPPPPGYPLRPDYPPRADYPPPPDYPPVPPSVRPAWYPGPGYYPTAPHSPYGAGGPYGPGIPPGTNGKAIAALACALIGLVSCMCFVPSLVAIVLGVLAISEINRTGQAGYGLAVSGVVIGMCTVLFAMASFYVLSGS